MQVFFYAFHAKSHVSYAEMLAFTKPVLYYGITVTNNITVTNKITVYCAMISRAVNECSQTLMSDAN